MVGFFETEYALLTVPNIDRDEMRLGQLRTIAVGLVLAIACGILLRFAWLAADQRCKDEEVRLEIAVSTEFTSRRGCRPSLPSRLLALETAVRSTRSDRLASSI